MNVYERHMASKFALSHEEAHEILEDKLFQELLTKGWEPETVILQEEYHGVFVHRKAVKQCQWSHERFGVGAPFFTTRDALLWEYKNTD